MKGPREYESQGPFGLTDTGDALGRQHVISGPSAPPPSRCAFLVAFFPILSNMVQGLKSVDHNLLNLFDLYGASRRQGLLHLKLPAAQPYFMRGLRTGGALPLIAWVGADCAAGSGGPNSGLAFRLLEAQYRQNMPRLFAALLLLSALGVAIFAFTSFISWLSLHRWHESSLKREN